MTGRILGTARAVAAAAIGGALCGLGGCESSQGYFMVHARVCLGDLIDLDVNTGWKWGQPPEGPPALTPKGTVPIGEYTLETYCDQDGNPWVRNPVNDKYYPVFQSPLPPPGPTGDTPGPTRQEIWTVDGGAAPSGFLVCRDDHEIGLGDGEYGFDQKAGTAFMEFVLPADFADAFVDPAETDFSFTVALTETLEDGSLWVRYEGTPNSVLGMAMQQGISRLERDVAGVGLVEVILDTQYSAAFFLIDGEAYEDEPFRLISVETAGDPG